MIIAAMPNIIVITIGNFCTRITNAETPNRKITGKNSLILAFLPCPRIERELYTSGISVDFIMHKVIPERPYINKVVLV